jgi:hypothetical protein
MAPGGDPSRDFENRTQSQKEETMAGMLSQFSDIQRTAVYSCIALEIICEAKAETAAPPKSESHVLRFFRLPSRLITAVADFNRSHSAACIEKMTVFPATECGDPWDADGERQLEAEVLRITRSITGLAIEGWNLPPRHAAILADIAASELRQLIREEYEAGRDAHLHATVSQNRNQASSAPSGTRPSSKRKRRSNRKAPINEILAVLEKKNRDALRRDFSDPDTVYEKMVAEFYSLSAEDLEDPVNEELESRGIEPVCAKTISRSEKYKSWKKYRRHMVSPASADADCGPAFNKPGYRTPTVNNVGDAAVMANGLTERSGRRLRSNGGSRSGQDRAADEWAKSAGVVLPPAD